MGSMLMILASNSYSGDSDSDVPSPSSILLLASSSELGYASLSQFEKNCFSCLSYVEGLALERTARNGEVGRENGRERLSRYLNSSLHWLVLAASTCIIHKIRAHGKHMHKSRAAPRRRLMIRKQRS